MKLDTSVAPEIALLATAAAAAAPATVGSLAACLRRLEADPQRWWDLVRFDPARPVRIPVPRPGPGCEAWLLVLPPGYRGEVPPPGQDGAAQDAADEGGDVTCLVAGEIAEQAGPPDRGPGRPLLPGRIRVRGGGASRRLVNAGRGYAVSLHARPALASPGA